MRMNKKPLLQSFSFVFAFALLGVFFTIVPEVLAVVGRPATPMSYAGVARRSVRR